MAFKIGEHIFDETDVRTIPNYNERALKELYPNCKIHWCKSDGTWKLIEYVNYGVGERPIIRRSFYQNAVFDPVLDLLKLENSYVKSIGKKKALHLSAETEALERLEIKKAIKERARQAGQMMVDEFWKKRYPVGNSDRFPILKAKGIVT